MRAFRADLHVLTGAYAVDAVDDAVELGRFERHLRRCQQCAGEVHDLTEATTRLAFASALTPPAPMRSRVLAAIARTRQLPPVVDREPSLRQWRPGGAQLLVGAIAAAAVVAVTVLGVVLAQTRSQLGQARSRATALAAVLAAPDARARTAPIAVGGTATVVYSLALHSVIVTSASLPPPPAGKVYELWLIGPPRVRPAGFLPVVAQASATAGSRRSSSGQSAPVLVTGLRLGDELGLTIEPVGGTRMPTTTPILLIPLRA